MHFQSSHLKNDLLCNYLRNQCNVQGHFYYGFYLMKVRAFYKPDCLVARHLLFLTGKPVSDKANECLLHYRVMFCQG